MPETSILRLLALAKESMTLFILTALHHLGRTTFVHTVLALRSQELPFALSLPESIMETSNASLTFESVDEILQCDHSIEPSLAVLSLGTICFSIFIKMKFGMFLDSWVWTLLGVKGLSPNINTPVLLTVLHIFLMVLVGRICLQIKTPQLQ